MSTEQTLGFGLMCKLPRPGLAKTRLVPAVGAVAAARIARVMLEDCALTALAAAETCALDPVAFYRPAGAEGGLRDILGERWHLACSDLGDLGASMQHALRVLLQRCPAGALIMGADVPMLQAADIARASAALRSGDARTVVICPSVDGGYCLIGIRCVQRTASLFAPMPWGTADVLTQTRKRAEVAGLRVVLLPQQRDVDEPSDLDWLQTQLAQDATRAPRTARVLADLFAAHDRSQGCGMG